MQVAQVTTTDYVLVTAGTLLQCVIPIVCFRRRLYPKLPWFLAYTLYSIFQTFVDMALLAMKSSVETYFYTYYVLQVFILALSFGVIYEVFDSVLEPYDALRRVGSKLFITAAVVLVALGIVFVVFGTGVEYRMVRLIILTQRSLRVIQVGLLIFLFTLSRSLGLSWRSYSFGIALGYGVYACIDLVLTAIRLEYGQTAIPLQSLFNMLGYGTACGIWVWYVLQTEQVAQPVRVIPYNDIAKWNEKLEELLKRKAA